MLQNKQEKYFSRAGWRQAVVCVRCLLILCLSMSMAVGCRDNGGAMIITAEMTEQEAWTDENTFPTEGGAPSGQGKEETVTSENVTAASIYVHVCGQVVTPGVYSLPEGSRVWDVVEAAGGFLPEAASQAVNLAMMVADGSKVTIPDETEAEESGFRWYETDGGKALTIGGAAVGGSNDLGQEADTGNRGSVADGRVDINRADVAALMTIPGIGQTRAEAIVAYRETRGSFGSIEEIMQVTGIKDGLFAKIREYITVGG